MPADATQNQNQNQNTDPTWFEQVGADLKAKTEFKETFGKMPKLDDVMNAHLELASKAKGMDGMVKIPGENASDQEYEAFLKQLGVPDKPDGYSFTAPANLPEGLKADADIDAWFRDLAFEVGLLPGQAKTIYDKYNERMIGSYTAGKKAENDAISKAEEAMRGEWKGDYDKNIELARRALKTFGGDDLVKILETVEIYGIKLGNHPAINKTFREIGMKIGEDNLVKGEPTSRQSGTEYTLDDVYPSMVGMGGKK
jgi:hypothetical protein